LVFVSIHNFLCKNTVVKVVVNQIDVQKILLFFCLLKDERDGCDVKIESFKYRVALWWHCGWWHCDIGQPQCHKCVSSFSHNIFLFLCICVTLWLTNVTTVTNHNVTQVLSLNINIEDLLDLLIKILINYKISKFTMINYLYRK